MKYQVALIPFNLKGTVDPQYISSYKDSFLKTSEMAKTLLEIIG